MTDWKDFAGNQENGVLVSVELLQQIINNTTNIYERIMVLESLKGGGVPIGAVMIWKGSYKTIPDGFQLADGTNGTPDLRDRFLMGIGASETDDNLLETGGETQHVHSMGTLSNASKHTHSVYLNSGGGVVSAQSGTGLAVAMMGHNHSWSAVTNSNDEHTHLGTYSAADCLPYFTKYYWIARIPA
jgi:hypothetical protein